MSLLKSICSGAVVLTLASAASSAAERSYVSGNFMLSLDGVKTGFIKSIDGGAIKSDVVNEAIGEDLTTRKHIDGVKYEDVSMQIGFSAGKPLYDWISDTFDRRHARRDGAFSAADFDFKEKQVVTFHQALINEITIPACDGASKDPAYMTVKFSPEELRWSAGSGKKIEAKFDNTKQKQWLPSNFRLNIPGLDCTKVQKIDAFTVKQTVVQNTTGNDRDYQKEPAKLEIPNLKVTLAATSAATWIDWSDDFIIKGNNGEDKEKNGTLTFLSANLQEELVRVSLFNVGIYRVQRPFGESSERINSVTVELYVERMEIDFMAQFEK